MLAVPVQPASAEVRRYKCRNLKAWCLPRIVRSTPEIRWSSAGEERNAIFAVYDRSSAARLHGSQPRLCRGTVRPVRREQSWRTLSASTHTRAVSRNLDNADVSRAGPDDQLEMFEIFRRQQWLNMAGMVSHGGYCRRRGALMTSRNSISHFLQTPFIVSPAASSVAGASVKAAV